MTAGGAPSERNGRDHNQSRHDVLSAGDADTETLPDCQTCGACCSYSSEWPRFTMETDEALDLIPPQFVAADQRGMRCEGERCSALSGRIGVSTSCTIYDVRPDVCRACLPGDSECRTARWAFGLERSSAGSSAC